MQPVTDKFKAEIRKSHRVLTYVDVIAPNQEKFRLNVTDGSVTVDRTASNRRQCTVDCVDPTGTITPTSVDAVLTPFGTEIRPYRGVQYSDDDTDFEVVPLGVFRISDVTVADQIGGSSQAGSSGGGGTPLITIDASDLSRTVSRDKFIDIYTVAQGYSVVQAIKDILARTFPNLDYDSIGSTLLTTAPLVFDVNSDPWEAVQTLGDSLGCEVFFGAIGEVHIHPAADIDHLPAPDWTFIEGPGCTMLEASIKYSDDPGYNGVVVIGQSPADELAPVRSVVWDSEPSSPTYHLGPYGEVPLVITDQNVSTQSDADAMAAATLSGVLGFSTTLTLTSAVNPALDVNDTVQVVRLRSGISGSYSVDKLTIPLMASETQEVDVRQKRTV